MTAVEYRIKKLDAAVAALDALEVAGVILYGAAATAVEDARAALVSEEKAETLRHYEEDLKNHG